MKVVLTGLAFMFCFNVFAQYVVTWNVKYTKGINKFELQQSKDNTVWMSIATVSPTDQLSYNDTLNLQQNNHYRVSATVDEIDFYSPSILVTAILPVIIAYPKFTHIKVKE